jgi:hypothetical protein
MAGGRARNFEDLPSSRLAILSLRVATASTAQCDRKARLQLKVYAVEILVWYTSDEGKV